MKLCCSSARVLDVRYSQTSVCGPASRRCACVRCTGSATAKRGSVQTRALPEQNLGRKAGKRPAGVRRVCSLFYRLYACVRMRPRVLCRECSEQSSVCAQASAQSDGCCARKRSTGARTLAVCQPRMAAAVLLHYPSSRLTT